jgi:hypothetical protein
MVIRAVVVFAVSKNWVSVLAQWPTLLVHIDLLLLLPLVRWSLLTGLPVAAAFKHFKVRSNQLHVKTQDAVRHQSTPWHWHLQEQQQKPKHKLLLMFIISSNRVQHFLMFCSMLRLLSWHSLCGPHGLSCTTLQLLVREALCVPKLVQHSGAHCSGNDPTISLATQKRMAQHWCSHAQARYPQGLCQLQTALLPGLQGEAYSTSAASL